MSIDSKVIHEYTLKLKDVVEQFEEEMEIKKSLGDCEEILTDYAINEIKEARKEIKRGEFHTEKEIIERYSELQIINRILDRRYQVLIELR